MTCLFGAFIFLQFTVLALANHAGEGYLTTAQRDLVYYGLQIFVILGYVLYSLFYRFCAHRRSQTIIAYVILGLFLLCGILLFAVGHDSLLYVIVAMIAVLCLGVIGGAAHLRMSMASACGARVARCMGLGSAAAVILQYLLQICWGVTPLLPLFMLAAFVLFLFMLRRPVPQAASTGENSPRPTPTRRIVFSVLIASTFILFACFYNESIHHLMIQSNYTTNVYSWPRLMMVPVYLLFALIGDRKNGKLVPIVSLSVTLIALMNVVLIGNAGAYWLNMCFFYFVIAAFTSFYLLIFWRLAPGTKHPALWAPFGRMLDSGMVLLTGAVNLSSLPAPVVLGADIVGVAMVILLMALNGDLNLAESLPTPDIDQTEPQAPTVLSPEEALGQLQERYDLTRRETEVLRELVCTEDKQTVISERLNIKVRTLQDYVTRLYRKTGATTRMGLSELYHNTINN